MSENVLEMEMSSSALGKVEIAPEVIEVIAGIAASEVHGVAQMRGNFASGVVERLGRKNHAKGVKVDLTDDGIVIDAFVVITFGLSIPEVAGQIQDNVRQTLLNMTALEMKEINIHVVGVQFESQKEPVEEAGIDEEL